MKRRNMRYRSAVVLASLLLILALAFFVAVWSGYTAMTAGDLLRIFLGGGSSKENLILFEFRMPRIVLGMLAGMGFALAGMVMQTLTRNALAEPGILGINAGAGLVVVVFLTLAGTLDMGAVMSLPFLALLGALLAGGLIYAFSVRKGQGLDPRSEFGCRSIQIRSLVSGRKHMEHGMAYGDQSAAMDSGWLCTVDAQSKRNEHFCFRG